MPKDPSRQPTTLARLAELIELYKEDPTSFEQERDQQAWLTWTYNFLSARKMYHRKAAVKTALLKKMAETLLSQDELAQVDAEAESKLEVE